MNNISTNYSDTINNSLRLIEPKIEALSPFQKTRYNNLIKIIHETNLEVLRDLNLSNLPLQNIAFNKQSYMDVSWSPGGYTLNLGSLFLDYQIIAEKYTWTRSTLSRENNWHDNFLTFLKNAPQEVQEFETYIKKNLTQEEIEYYEEKHSLFLAELTKEEFKFLIAHEIGHVVNRDQLKTLGLHYLKIVSGLFILCYMCLLKNYRFEVMLPLIYFLSARLQIFLNEHILKEMENRADSLAKRLFREGGKLFFRRKILLNRISLLSNKKLKNYTPIDVVHGDDLSRLNRL